MHTRQCLYLFIFYKYEPDIIDTLENIESKRYVALTCVLCQAGRPTCAFLASPSVLCDETFRSNSYYAYRPPKIHQSPADSLLMQKLQKRQYSTEIILEGEQSKVNDTST